MPAGGRRFATCLGECPGPGTWNRPLARGWHPRPWSLALGLGLSPLASRPRPLGPTAFRPRASGPWAPALSGLSPLSLGQGPCRMACYWPKLNARWPYICQSFFMHRICPLIFAAVRLFRVPCRQSAYDQQQCGLRSSSKKKCGV